MLRVWTDQAGRFKTCSSSSHGSAERIVVEGTGTLVLGITPNQPAKAFFCSPSGWKSGPCSFCPHPHRPMPSPAPPGGHIFKYGSFVQFSPTGTSFFEARCCMCAGLMFTHRSPLFCSSKVHVQATRSMHLFLLHFLALFLSPYEKGLHLFILFFYFCSRSISNSISLSFLQAFLISYNVRSLQGKASGTLALSLSRLRSHPRGQYQPAGSPRSGASPGCPAHHSVPSRHHPFHTQPPTTPAPFPAFPLPNGLEFLSLASPRVQQRIRNAAAPSPG